jgi:uncharacterized protein
MNYLVTSFALLASVALLGCFNSKPARFYSLSATASPGTAPTNVAVLVEPVTIPASVDRPQFVVQVAANRIEVDEFNLWDSPLGDSVARVIAADLLTQLGTPDVAIAPLPTSSPVHSQNSNPSVLMMESRENRHCDDAADGLCASAVGRVFV